MIKKIIFMIAALCLAQNVLAGGTVIKKPAGWSYDSSSSNAALDAQCKGLPTAQAVGNCAKQYDITNFPTWSYQGVTVGAWDCLQVTESSWSFGVSWMCALDHGAIYKNYTAAICPQNSNEVAGVCTCTANYMPSADQKSCVVLADVQNLTQCPLPTLQPLSSYYEVTAPNGSPPLSTCNGTCAQTYQGNSGGFSTVENGVVKYYAAGSYSNDGWTCSVGTNPMPASVAGANSLPVDSCPDGQTFVQNAFGFICATTGPSLTDGTTATGVPDGVPVVSETTGTSTTTTNPDGSTTTVSTSTTVSPPIQFPGDYARSGESATAAQLVKTGLDTLHSDLSVTASVADPLAVDTATMPSMVSTFDTLKNWTLPVHVSTCPAPSIDLSGVLGAGKVYSFNAHCQLAQDHFAALQAAMMVVWSMLALFVVLRA